MSPSPRVSSRERRSRSPALHWCWWADVAAEPFSFDAFSSLEPGSTSLENALLATHHCPQHACASPAGPATMRRLPEQPVKSPDRPQPYPHPARLILILSLAPTVGLGIGRFAYALVLPDMR